jgi:hypothetical protein
MAQFDIQAARKAGATDEQIIQYLRQHNPSFDVDAAIKSGASVGDVANYLAANASPPSQSSAKGQSVIDYSRALNNGLSFGFSDNVEAALNTLPIIGNKKPNESYGDAYNRNLAQIRGEMEKFQQAKPLQAGATELLGGAIPALLTGGGSAATQSMSLPARMATGAGVGAVMGGLGNAGNSNADTTPEFLRALGTGAGIGAVGGATVPVLMEGLNRLARGGMGFATKISPADRRYGKTPEKAALEYTSGTSPVRIQETAKKSIDTLVRRNQNLAKGQFTDISGVQKFTADAVDKLATGSIDDDTAKVLKEIAAAVNKAPDQFYGYSANGTIAPIQDGANVIRMKQEFANKFINWNPQRNMSDNAQRIAKEAYHMLDKSVDSLSPEIAKNNQVISSLIPVKSGAEMMSRQPSMGQQAMQRMTAMTGASLGGYAGYEAAGLPGAIMGVAAPVILANPRTPAAASRAAYAVSQSTPAQRLATYLLSQSPRLVQPKK